MVDVSALDASRHLRARVFQLMTVKDLRAIRLRRPYGREGPPEQVLDFGPVRHCHDEGFASRA